MSERFSPSKRELHPLDDDPQFAADTARPSHLKKDTVLIRPVPPGVVHRTAEGETHLLDYLRVALQAALDRHDGIPRRLRWDVPLHVDRVPLYTARVQLLIENDNPNVVKFDEVYETNKLTNDYYQTQYKILQSRLIARRTIEAEKLWKHPALVGPTMNGAPTSADSLRTLLQSVSTFWPVAAGSV